MGSVRIFSRLDPNRYYWQDKVTQEDCDKMANTFNHGLFGFTRMPFELENAPKKRQRAVDIPWTKAKWKFAFVNVDDIVLFSRTPDEHMGHARQILTLLQG